MSTKASKKSPESVVSVWLGVVTRDVPTQSGQPWWCFIKKAQRGDTVVFYRKGAGIFRIDTVLDPIDDPLGDCRSRGLVRMATTPNMYLKSAIDFKTLRSHPVLREMPAVKRRFQGTCFSISDEQWPVLRAMALKLKASSPKDAI